MINVLVLLSFVAGSTAIGAECEFDNFSKNYPPIFVEQHVEDMHMLLPATNTLYIPHERKITAFCNNLNQKIEDLEITSTNEQIRFDCYNGTIIFEERRDNDKFLLCHTPGFYRQPIWGCLKFSYIIALLVEDTPIVLSEVCYDVEKKNTEFVHYILANRSPILQRQIEYNPVDITKSILTRARIPPSKMSFVHFSNDEIKKQVKLNIGSHVEVVSFSEGAIVPDEVYFKNFVYRNKVNTVIWWDPLKNGNWKLVQDSLGKATNWTSFDIYAGSSGVVRVRNQQLKWTNLELQKMSRTKPIPLYIWNYIKPKDAMRHFEVVIIGVNSPYVSSPNSAEIRGVCHEDICHRISWLNDIQNTIKLPAFGYIICCEPSMVLGHLHGVPEELISDYKLRNPNSTPFKKPHTNYFNSSPLGQKNGYNNNGNGNQNFYNYQNYKGGNFYDGAEKNYTSNEENEYYSSVHAI